MTFSFQKLVGAGNDFIFVDADNFPNKETRSAVARHFCDRKWGIGADGMVFFQKIDSEKGFFLWDFYNNDGSNAEMCGNAARCSVLYCFENFNLKKFSLETRIGTIEGQKLSDSQWVSWNIKNTALTEKTISLENGKSFSGHFINTGVPHFVLLTALDQISREDCLLIQNHKSFAPDKTNVTLLMVDSSGQHQSKSFERGVRDFTLACGTGVIACAYVLQSLKKEEKYSINVPGGRLNVKLSGPTVTLIGPAIKTFVGVAEWNRGN